MKRLLFAALLLGVTSAFTAKAEISITIGQPGFYGRIDIGGYPQPQLIYPQPVIIQPVPVYRAPVYLHVPPGHAKDWQKHCDKYKACGEPVYFVQDNWYEREYLPRYRERHGSDLDKHEYKDKHESQGMQKHESKHEHRGEHKNKHWDEHKRGKHKDGKHKHDHKGGKHKQGNKHGGHGNKH